MSSSGSTDSFPYPALDATVQAINWDSILQTVRDEVGATTARWGEQKSGAFNLVRFLHLDGDQVVVRLPLYPDPELVGPMIPKMMNYNISKTASMVASMEYVAAHTSIPIPRVIYSCLDPEIGNVGSPYVVTSKAEGKSLSHYWSDMPDAQRDIVLQQVIDILLQLSTLRFDKIGNLFKAADGTWVIRPAPDDGDTPEATYMSGTDECLAIANARLHKIQHGQFGKINNDMDYIHNWFLRSRIPYLYDSSLDAKGFPLMHGDFHSQNIFVVDADTCPRITSVIDWDNTGTTCTSSFAQYPFFIVDHPAWPDDHILRPRNVRDQASFNRLVEQAERDKFPDSEPSLSRAFANCYGIYLFEQCIHDELMYNTLFLDVVRHILGPDAEEQSWPEYVEGLESGILKDVVEKLREEADVATEAREVLGDEVNLDGPSREGFIELARKYGDRFSAEGKVVPWLNKISQGVNGSK